MKHSFLLSDEFGAELFKFELGSKMAGVIMLFCFLITAAVISSASAEIVNETLPNGVMVTADYKPGDNSKPALIVLHGFLQTYNFQATYNIIEGLSGLGYTVVGPNLSLGVPNRKRSLQCDAIHQHTLADDLAEIDFWVNWLENKGNKKIIFVGHSWGSQHALVYLNERKNRNDIVAVVAISLVPEELDGKLLGQQLKQAQKLEVETNTEKALAKYVLSFCKDYTATSQSYLSYAQWGDARLLSALKTISQFMPVYAILGSADKRLREDWISELQGAGAKVSVVEGANHFFSSASEFDLIDQLESALKTTNLAADD